ncbi:hypothetical protein MST22_15635 [Virgibacillus halodenitrificans]|uniref:hypothetical protein n=1 Tax=Virgibacillus halodenitrificans TaxID=1482 RepID=UPI001FB3B3EB|nr:hypothetical protein [Virgibacillus halodenitrificans]MCJ0932579.1 hypothetical protein [Virgibacillus halodenitrificans]
MNINFNGYDCKVVFGRYGNGNTAIQLMGKVDNQLVAVASVNGESIIGSELVGIKNWSENEGMVNALISANIIEAELAFIEPTGFVAIEYYPLTEEAKQAREDALGAIS